MNFFKKVYCRLFQFGFRVMLPFMPYRQPKILNDEKEAVGLLQNLKIKCVQIVTDSGIKSIGLTEPMEKALTKEKIKVVIFDKVVPNPTVDNIEDGVVEYTKNNCEAIIGFGGGSSMDCAKMIGARISNPKKSVEQMKGLLKVKNKLPLLIAVPTTAGTGSETTLAAIITNAQTKHKYAINDFDLIPKYAVLDEKLTFGLPKHITSTTGIDALTHAIEAYIGGSTTRQTRSCSLKAIKLIFENLEVAFNDGKNKTARKNMLLASYLAGVAFTKSYVGYVHAIAHSLGGQYGTPHGLANAVILPYVLRNYKDTINKKLYKISVYCGFVNKGTNIENAKNVFLNKLDALLKNLDIPNKIADIKVKDIDNMSINADKEANPLYPVPMLMNAKELSKIYYQIKK